MLRFAPRGFVIVNLKRCYANPHVCTHLLPEMLELKVITSFAYHHRTHLDFLVLLIFRSQFVRQFMSWVSVPEMKGETTWFAKAAPGTPDSVKFLWLFITHMPTGVRIEINSFAN